MNRRVSLNDVKIYFICIIYAGAGWYFADNINTTSISIETQHIQKSKLSHSRAYLCELRRIGAGKYEDFSINIII